MFLRRAVANEDASQSLEGLLEQTAGPYLQGFRSSRWPWGPIICISPKFPGHTLGTTLSIKIPREPSFPAPFFYTIAKTMGSTISHPCGTSFSCSLLPTGPVQYPDWLLSAPLALASVTSRTDLCLRQEISS